LLKEEKEEAKIVSLILKIEVSLGKARREELARKR